MHESVRVARSLVLQTPRLLLAALSAEDAGALHRLYADWLVAQQLRRIPYPFALGDAEAFIARAQEELVAGRGYTLGVFPRESLEFAGISALHVPARAAGVERAEPSSLEGLGTLGYSLLPAMWGQGYATESGQRMVRFAFELLGLTSLQASVRRENLASRRVLERLGFRLAEAGELEQPLHGGPAHVVDRYRLWSQQLLA